MPGQGPVDPVVDENSNVTTVPTTTPEPTLFDPFTLFNTNSSYGINSIVSSQAVQLVDERREGYEYVSK